MLEAEFITCTLVKQEGKSSCLVLEFNEDIKEEDITYLAERIRQFIIKELDCADCVLEEHRIYQ